MSAKGPDSRDLGESIADRLGDAKGPLEPGSLRGGRLHIPRLRVTVPPGAGKAETAKAISEAIGKTMRRRGR